MIIVTEVQSSTTECSKAEAGVVIHPGEVSITRSAGGLATTIVEAPQDVSVVEVANNVVTSGSSPNVVVSVGAAVPSGTGAAVGTGQAGLTLILNTLATAGVMIYNLSNPISPQARVMLFMNGVLTDSLHDGVRITILGYTPGEIASDDELKAYY